MARARIDARQAATDIRSGMSDAEIMAKYSLSPVGLEDLLRKLVRAGILSESELTDRLYKTAQTVAFQPDEFPAEPEPVPREAPLRQVPQIRLKAREVLADIRSGMTDLDLMKKYGLSAAGVQSLLSKLTEAGILDTAALGRIRHVPERTVELERHVCPACRMPQFYAFDTCPQCGIIVWKFLEKRAIGERSLDKPPGRTTTVEKEPHPKPAEEEAVVRTRTGQSAAQPPPPVQGAPLPQPSEKQQTTGAPPSEATGQAQGTLYRRDTPEPSDERPRAGPYSEPPTGQALPLVEGKDPSKPSVRELATQEPGRETRYRGPSHEQRQELIEWIGWTIWADMEKLGKLQSALAFLHFLAGFARRNIGWIVAIALVIVSASVSLYLLKAPLDAIQGQVSYGSVDRELYPGGSEEPLVRVWGRAGTGASGSPQEGTGR